MKRCKRVIISLMVCMLTLVLLVPPVLATAPSVTDPLRYSIQLDEKNNRLQLQVANPTMQAINLHFSSGKITTLLYPN